MDTLTARGQDRCSGTLVSATATAICPLLTTPALAITQNCPTTPVAVGSVLTFSGVVSNPGDVNLTNVYVYNSQAGATPVTGPIELAPGQTETYTGSYVVQPKGMFGTIAPTPTANHTDRFGVSSNYSGLTFADPDEGYGATLFYSIHKDDAGPNYTIDTISGPGTITHRFSIILSGIDGITFAAPDVGYGPVNFYYVRHDNGGVSHFGVIKPGGAVGTATDLFNLGANFDTLTFAAPDVGFGANLFYYLRHDANGRSFFGTINPALPGTITDRFSGNTIGNNYDALAFASTDVGDGPNRFYTLRHDANNVSTFGFIAPTATSGVIADRFGLGSLFNELTFTATDVGYGANLFYYLRSAGYEPETANITGSFVTTTAADTCQGRLVTGVANCSGSLTQPVIARPSSVGGVTTITWSAVVGTTYTVQSKSLIGGTWTDLPGNVTASGTTASKSDATGATTQRFYRVMITQ
jgi:hypothetical protein